MNLYLLLAFAFGAVTAAAEAPVVRAPRASVVMRSEARAERGPLIRSGRASRPAAIVVSRTLPRPTLRRPHATPSSPRAPATIG